jgi:hypothetical protein
VESAEVAESIYDGSLQAGWQESGTAARQPGAGRAASVRFDDSGEWVLQRPGLSGRFGALLFRVHTPPGEGEFLEIRVGSSSGRYGPWVKLKPDHRTDLGDGWAQVVVPTSELDPDGAPFDRVALRPFRPFGEWVLFDKIALAKPPQPASSPAGPGAAAATRTRIACDAAAAKISPYIYGIAYGDSTWPLLRAPVRRWGGNPATRYNFEANVDNRAQDWFFENRPASSYVDYLAENSAHGALTALTVPIIGWVAKDGVSYSFPVSKFGPQAKTDPWRPDVGNGVSASGANIAPGPPTQTSVAAPPEWTKRWVAAITAADAKKGKRSIYEYILDNEPMLWSTTHRDVCPEPLGYDELLDRTVQYGSAIREADPDAVIAGPAEWGWSNYFYSAKDLASRLGVHSDRRAHDDVALVEWYLRKLREWEKTKGVRVLDVFDLHYYPQAPNVYAGGAGGTDRATQLLRLRSTRSLWDDTYVDESWIKDTIRLIPRMKELVAANYPGRGISIGEWNFGGEKDITGAIATAEVLGRFAQFGVTSAFYWTAPPPGSPSAFGFLAYRNYDGKGGRFLDWYLPTTPASDVSFFASRDADGKHLVVIAINLTPDASRNAVVDLSACGSVMSEQAFTYVNGATAFAASSVSQDATTEIERSLPPWSITVFDVHLRETKR